MIGCLLHDLKNHVAKWRFAFSFLIIGFIFFWFTKPTMIGIDRMVYGKINLFYKLDWLYERFGMVLMILGTLMIIEKLMVEIRQNLFLKIGQNTLTIYIIHMILLYGSLTGIGVNDYFNKNLTPWEAAIGALTFISVHLLIIYFLDYIKEKLEFILKPIRKFWEVIYGIKPAKD
jgi:fucose 4-O-acetylase-like acetyltransferase